MVFLKVVFSIVLGSLKFIPSENLSKNLFCCENEKKETVRSKYVK